MAVFVCRDVVAGEEVEAGEVLEVILRVSVALDAVEIVVGFLVIVALVLLVCGVVGLVF